MARVMMVKSLQSLHPADDEARALLRTIGQGEIVSVEVRRPRNVRFHAKFFAMLKIILDNQEHYKSIEDILDVAKLSVGHYRTIRTAKYGDVKIPNSISFAAMDNAEFSDFYDKVVAWIASDVIPGLKRKDLDAEVEAALLGFGDNP